VAHPWSYSKGESVPQYPQSLARESEISLGKTKVMFSAS
jgi:hypothetical protein